MAGYSFRPFREAHFNLCWFTSRGRMPSSSIERAGIDCVIFSRQQYLRVSIYRTGKCRSALPYGVNSNVCRCDGMNESGTCHLLSGTAPGYNHTLCSFSKFTNPHTPFQCFACPGGRCNDSPKGSTIRARTRIETRSYTKPTSTEVPFGGGPVDYVKNRSFVCLPMASHGGFLAVFLCTTYLRSPDCVCRLPIASFPPLFGRFFFSHSFGPAASQRRRGRGRQNGGGWPRQS